MANINVNINILDSNDDLEVMILNANNLHADNKVLKSNATLKELVGQLNLFGKAIHSLIAANDVRPINAVFGKLKGIRPELKVLIRKVFPNIRVGIKGDGDATVRFVNEQGDLTKAKFEVDQHYLAIFVDAVYDSKDGVDPRSDKFKAAIKVDKSADEKKQKAMDAIVKQIAAGVITIEDIRERFGIKADA